MERQGSMSQLAIQPLKPPPSLPRAAQLQFGYNFFFFFLIYYSGLSRFPSRKAPRVLHQHSPGPRRALAMSPMGFAPGQGCAMSELYLPCPE